MTSTTSTKPLPPLLEPPEHPPSNSVFSQIARTPYPAWLNSVALITALPLMVRSPAGFPQLVQLPLFSAIFVGSGYMTHAGDAVNGAGTTTAWSLTYLFLNGRKALVSRKPLPILLGGIVGMDAAICGWEYFMNS